MNVHHGAARVLLMRVALAVLALAATPGLLSAQVIMDPPPPQQPPLPAGPPVTVSGIVLNSATGQPLPRALVELDGTPGLGILTNGEGQFEIPGVPSGDQTFSVSKPGFGAALSDDDLGNDASHSVRVAGGMTELKFLLSPKSAVYGHVSLSSGVPALGIGLNLLRKTISHGRASWGFPDDHTTTPDGNFRYSSLNGGTYLLVTQPEFNNDDAKEPACNPDTPSEMSGYAAEFSNGTRDIANAAQIVVDKGQSAEVNLWLQETKFHLMRARLLQAPAGKDWSFSSTLLEGGQPAPYALHEEEDHSLCAYLPDGSYTLLVTASSNNEEQSESRPRPPRGAHSLPPGNMESDDLIGGLDFSVEGEAVRNLRVLLAHAALTSVPLSYEPRPPAPVKVEPLGDKDEERSPNREFDPLQLSGTRVFAFGQQGDNTVSATQNNANQYELGPAVPGAYWIQASADGDNVCLGSVTAAGQDLAQVPWIAGPSGAGPPIDVVVRTDCAKLTVQMPAALSRDAPGEGSTVWVYAVPQFNTVDDVSQISMEPFGDHTVTFSNLTPGTYRIFALPAPHNIEFHNPAALDRLGPSQLVTLPPNGDVKLLLEEISQ